MWNMNRHNADHETDRDYYETRAQYDPGAVGYAIMVVVMCGVLWWADKALELWGTMLRWRL
mgnify:CR=1 FL=1